VIDRFSKLQMHIEVESNNPHPQVLRVKVSIYQGWMRVLRERR